VIFFKHKIFKLIVSAGITALLVYLVVIQFPTISFRDFFNNINLVWLLPVIGLYLVSTILRAYRYQLLGLRSVGLFRLVNVGFIHFFLSGILPFRSGEFSFVYLINKDGKTHISKNISALMLARIMDFFAVVISLIVSLVVVFPEKIKELDSIVVSAFAVLFFLFLVVIILLFATEKIGSVIKFFTRLLIRKQELSEKILQRWRELSDSLLVLKDWKVFGKTLLVSMVSWALLYGITAMFLNSLGYFIDYWPAVFITSFPPIASLIPIGTIGNFGTVEAGWVFGLSALGFGLDLAVALSVALHILTILMQIIFSVISAAILKFSK